MPNLMESIISLDVGAQEPWPNDVQLFQPYPMEQILLPDNANCLATQAYLHMCGLPFKIEHRANAEFMSPSGKVPFIKCGAFVVSELEPIVQFVANKGISLTQDFDNEQKSDLRAYMSLIFSVLMNAELYICWCDKRTYNEVTKVRNGSVYPWPLNHYQNWTKRSAVIKKLKLLNWYQKTLGSVYQEVETCCQALSERLEGKEYFFGSKPTEVDALLYGHTYSIFSNPVEFPNLFVIFQRFPNLIIHCRRICFHYTFLRYIDFTKTDTDIDSSRQSSIQSLILNPQTSLLAQIWNYLKMNMFGSRTSYELDDDNNLILAELETVNIKDDETCDMFKDISFKKTVIPSVNFNPSFDEDMDSPKSINYLGHKVIQQHLQQDLRNKLSDFTIDTNSDLWSEKDLCYIIRDSDFGRPNANNVAGKDDTTFDLVDGDNIKNDLETKYSSGSSHISEQLDWLRHGSDSTSTIDMNFSHKFNVDSFTENINDTLNDQENIEIDVDNKSNCNVSELDWMTDYASETKIDKNNIDNNNNDGNDEIVQEIITFDVNNSEEANPITIPKFCNCSIDGDLDWLHDFSKNTDTDDIPIMEDNHDENIKDNLSLEQNKTIQTDINEDIHNLDVKCSASSKWTTIASASDSDTVNNLPIDNMESTVELMNDIINSVEQMNNNYNNSNIIEEKKNSKSATPKSKSTSETTLETYSDNHICNENCCNNIYVVNDDSFWDDDISNSKSISENGKSAMSLNVDVNQNSIEAYDEKKSLEKKHSEIKISCEKAPNVGEKISNESLKKYFSCESCKQVIGQIENNESRSSMIEGYPVEKLSNVILAVNEAYPPNEFLKLLKSDYDISQYTNTNSISYDRTNSALVLHNSELYVEQSSISISNSNTNNTSNISKPRVFRKCRRLLNKPREANNPTMKSDSKILQMYKEKICEHRNKSINDIENIRTACSVLKSFNTKPEACSACSLCKFSSNPSISHSCKCCDSNFKFKSKSTNKIR